MPLLDRGEYHLYYEWGRKSSGPVLILSHSLGADRRMWQPQMDGFERHFQVLRYDHPGHGLSDARPAVVPIADYGREVLALMDDLGIDKAHFCGLSLGGMIGMWLGAHAGARFEKIALCSTTAHHENPQLLRGRIAEIRRSGLQGITDSVLGKWFTPRFRGERPDIMAEMSAMLLETTAQGYADTAETVLALDLRADLPAITVPVLVVYGSHDEATAPSCNTAIAAAIPHARQLCLPTAHLSNVEAPQEFTAGVVGFLTGAV